MNTIPTKINSYNVYNKGNRLLGVGEEMTLPDFEPSSETVPPAVSPASMKVPSGRCSNRLLGSSCATAVA